MWPTVVILSGMALAPFGACLGWIVGARVGDQRGVLGYYAGLMILLIAVLAAGALKW